MPSSRVVDRVDDGREVLVGVCSDRPPDESHPATATPIAAISSSDTPSFRTPELYRAMQATTCRSRWATEPRRDAAHRTAVPSRRRMRHPAQMEEGPVYDDLMFRHEPRTPTCCRRGGSPRRLPKSLVLYKQDQEWVYESLMENGRIIFMTGLESGLLSEPENLTEKHARRTVESEIRELGLETQEVLDLRVLWGPPDRDGWWTSRLPGPGSAPLPCPPLAHRHAQNCRSVLSCPVRVRMKAHAGPRRGGPRPTSQVQRTLF